MGYSADDVEQIHERPRDQRVQVDSRTYTVSLRLDAFHGERFAERMSSRAR